MLGAHIKEVNGMVPKKMNKSCLKIMGGLLFLALGGSAFGQKTLDDAHQLPLNPSVWRSDIGSGFKAGTYNAGFMAGGTIGTPVWGTRQHHDLALGNVNAGWILPPSFRQTVLAGNLELRGELFGGGQFHPREHYVTGLTVVPRYDFATGSRFVPFIDGGLGLTATDIGRPDLGGIFEFNLQFGTGAYYFIRPDLAVSIEYRWLHISDAGITKVNQGVNAQFIAGGLTWFF